MHKFSARDIETLTGLTAHKLRMLGQRYDFFKTERRPRFYSNDDVKNLLRLSFLHHNGWKMASLIALPDDETETEVQGIRLSEANYKTFGLQLLSAAVDLNEAAFARVLHGLIETAGLEKTIVDVCYPYLLRLAVLWKIKDVVPVQQRFSDYLIQTRLLSETDKFSALQNEPPELVLFSPGKEAADLPLLFLNYLLRKNGWTVFYLGKNGRLADVKEAARPPGIRYLYLHLLDDPGGIFVDDYLETLRKTFPGKIILASGKGLEQSQRTFVNVHLLQSDEEIHRLIESKKKEAKTTGAKNKRPHGVEAG